MRKVHIGTSFAQAELIRALLRRNGIESILENEGAMSVSGVPLPAAPLGVLVEDQCAERAMRLIDEELKHPLEAVKTELTVRSACPCGKSMEFPKTEDPPEECPWCGRPVRSGVATEPEPQGEAVKPGRTRLWALLVISIVGGLLLFLIRGGKGDDGRSTDASHDDMSRRLRARIAAIPSIEIPPIDPEPVIATLSTEYPEESARFNSALGEAGTVENLIERWLNLRTELSPDWAVDNGLRDSPLLERPSARLLKSIVLLEAGVLQKLRTLSAAHLLDGRLLERQLERGLLAYTLYGADLVDPLSALWGVFASRHLKDKPSLLAERLEQVPGVVHGVIKELGPLSGIRIDAGLGYLNDALAILRDFEHPSSGERVQAAVGKAREALGEFGNRLRSLRKGSPPARPQELRWITFLLQNREFSRRTPRETAEWLLDESERAEVVWKSWAGSPDPGVSSYSFEDWRGVIQGMLVRARDLTIERGFADIPPGDLPEVGTSPYPARHAPEWPSYEARAFESPFHPRLLVTPWENSAVGSQRLARFGVLGASFPGRHLQMLLSRRDGTPLRRLYESSSLPEGWHEYCLRWALESEPADSPARMAQAGFRYVQGWKGAVEICFLAGTISEVEAVEMLRSGIGESDESARAFVGLATLAPLHSTSGLMGEHDILQLHDELRTILGERFDRKKFHTRLMGYGRTPIALIREELLRELK